LGNEPFFERSYDEEFQLRPDPVCQRCSSVSLEIETIPDDSRDSKYKNSKRGSFTHVIDAFEAVTGFFYGKIEYFTANHPIYTKTVIRDFINKISLYSSGLFRLAGVL
jgi:hypothetical protein